MVEQVDGTRVGPRPARHVTGLTRGRRPDGAYIPLFWRLFVPNATVLSAACAVLIVEPANGRVIALVGGLATLLAVNLMLMRRAFAPLTQLTNLMARVDPLRPGQRVHVPGPASEVTVLADTFNAMLDRLELERRDSGRRALSAQEEERRNLAAELHDDIGQTLTAMVLQLDRIAQQSDGPLRASAIDARDAAVGLVEDIRSVARRLRPEALDTLGLASALTNLIDRLTARTGLPVERHIDREHPALTPEADLVIYRVVQESLTNILRHAGATKATVSLAAHGGDVILTVTDDGVGFDPRSVPQHGIRNMRERALLIGGELTLSRGAGGRGTEIRLRIGREERRRP